MLRQKVNIKTENKNQFKKEQKEETATTTAAGDAADDDNDDDDDDFSDDEKGDQSMISSPVAHMWTSKDGCRPLVRPDDATSTGMCHALYTKETSF